MIFILAVVGILGVSASGPIMAATMAPALTIALWRNVFGAVVLGPPALMGNAGAFKSLNRDELKYTMIAATALALHFACFVTSVKLTSVAAATALVCLQAAWIALYQWIRGRRPSRPVMLGLGAALLGVVVITGFDMGLSRQALLGDVLAILGGALAAIYTLAGARTRRTLSTSVYSSICYALCSLILLALCLLFRQPLINIPAEAWWGIVAVTVASQLFGHTIFNYLLATISPLVVSMMILVEIPGAALLAGVFLGQSLPAGIYAGLGLILAGLAVVIVRQGRSGIQQ
ncbi:DMT family transporter [Arthrobacter sp. H35-D1]|uniref:DMT family transporter n=1 Tax=Arthrobacter sp. H35-D1 TaxID=3046202 RepID=UPI0024B928ED|nr:DMT family transporter [Arthrobacter sp. H35-D1]MDJ0312054.1 DMT family transporter [Arthrobacter sp. H35-D1]